MFSYRCICTRSVLILTSCEAGFQIKEVQDIYIPNVEPYIPNRNGFHYLMCGSGGSENSFNSVANHPFKKHDKVYHELSVVVLEQIYQELSAMKDESTKEVEKKKPNMFDGVEETKDDDDEPKEIQYSCIIIDDYANVLKQNDIQ
eukprot:gene13990-18761_t